MDVVIAAGLLAAGFVLARLLLLAMARPRRPAWAREVLVENLWCQVFIGSLALGLCFAGRAAADWQGQTFGWTEAGLLALTVAVCAAVFARPRRDAARAASAAAAVVPLTPPQPPRGARRPGTRAA